MQAGGAAGRLTGAEHSTSRTTPALPLMLAHADRAALVELLRAKLIAEKPQASRPWQQLCDPVVLCQEGL